MARRSPAMRTACGVRTVETQAVAQACLTLCLRPPRTRWPGPRKATLASLLRGSLPGFRLKLHLADDGVSVFRHGCKMGLEGIVLKRLGSRYRSGRSKDWLKFKNPEAPAVKREAEEDWGKAAVAMNNRPRGSLDASEPE